MRRSNSHFSRRLAEIAATNGQPRQPAGECHRRADGYNCWKKMRDRCNNPRNDNYRYYGGAGVKVCERWNNFWAFHGDMGPRPSPQHSVDRIDPSGDYTPENCRWASIVEQNRNRRSVKRLVVGGVTLITKDVAAIAGVDRSTVRKLLKAGLSFEKILSRYGFEIINSGAAITKRV